MQILHFKLQYKDEIKCHDDTNISTFFKVCKQTWLQSPKATIMIHFQFQRSIYLHNLYEDSSQRKMPHVNPGTLSIANYFQYFQNEELLDSDRPSVGNTRKNMCVKNKQIPFTFQWAIYRTNHTTAPTTLCIDFKECLAPSPDTQVSNTNSNSPKRTPCSCSENSAILHSNMKTVMYPKRRKQIAKLKALILLWLLCDKHHLCLKL